MSADTGYLGLGSNVGDRRATANFAVMYDRAEKVLPIDDYTLMAISGSFARAMEVVRYLRHSFKYFERSQLQPMSLDGKLSELFPAEVKRTFRRPGEEVAA